MNIARAVRTFLSLLKVLYVFVLGKGLTQTYSHPDFFMLYIQKLDKSTRNVIYHIIYSGQSLGVCGPGSVVGIATG